jgi:hypothetical protein
MRRLKRGKLGGVGDGEAPAGEGSPLWRSFLDPRCFAGTICAGRGLSAVAASKRSTGSARAAQ